MEKLEARCSKGVGMDCARSRRGATTILRLLAVTMALFVSALGPSPADAVIALQDVPPSINTVDGVVELSSDDGTSWAPAEPGMPVSAGDVLRTGDDGACVLDFSDKSVVALLPRSTITMLPDDPQQRLQLSSGHIWVQLGSAVGYRDAVLAPYALVTANETATFTLDFDESGGTIRAMEGRADLSTASGDYKSSAETGEALAATKSGYSIAYPFDVATEQAMWEPLFAVTTTSFPDEITDTTGEDTTDTTMGTGTTLGGTTGTYQPPDDSGAGERVGRSETALVVATGVLFLLLVAAATILVILLVRRRRQPPAGMPPTYLPAGPAQASTPGTAVFCRHCGTQLATESRFCRACGQEVRPDGPGTGG
jgi:zinc-ribbon domain/FecR protein